MRMHRALIMIAITAAAFGPIIGARAQQAPSGTPPPDAQVASNPVHKISLPQYPPELPAGPGKDAFLNNCVICHSARYVTMQPRFTKAVWQAEVQKMIAAYGASISPADKEAIVGYLVSFHGTKDAMANDGSR